MANISRQGLLALITAFTESIVRDEDITWGRQFATALEYAAGRIRAVVGHPVIVPAAKKEHKVLKVTPELEAFFDTCGTITEEDAKRFDLTLAQINKLETTWLTREESAE